MMSEFFEMGGYAEYVWPAYGVAAFILMALLVTSLRQAKSAESELAVLEAAVGSRRNRRSSNAADQGERHDA